MFPGFVSTYRDNDNYVHLFFYPGNDEGNHIYKNINFDDCPFRYTEVKFLDDSIDYKFYNKNISKLVCKLMSVKDNSITYKEMKIK